MRVLGVDPGFAVTGFGVIERTSGRLRPLTVGVIRTAPDVPARRLAELRRCLDQILDEYRPDEAALERLFFNANVRTAMGVAQAAGVVMETCASRGLDIADYTPLEVKSSVVGFGRAHKSQVQTMVATLLGLDAPPRPPDAADACAVAICHLNRSGLARALETAR